jgi:hypothetical protein
MRHARQGIAAMDLGTPRASQALGAPLTPATTLMLDDAQNWARIVRAKVVEA